MEIAVLKVYLIFNILTSNGQGQKKPLSPLCVIENSLVKCTILFQTVSSKAEAPEFEKSIYNPSGMYGMKVGGETSNKQKEKVITQC